MKSPVTEPRYFPNAVIGKVVTAEKAHRQSQEHMNILTVLNTSEELLSGLIYIGITFISSNIAKKKP